MKKISIVGLGLIGGSFGLALRAAGFTGQITGVSSPEAVDAACAAGAVDAAESLADAAGSADVLYLAQPIGRILDTIHKLEPLARPGLLVTDAGSTKQAICQAAAKHLKVCEFLGGHPMAGKELRGVQHSDSQLFRNRPYALVPGNLETSAAQNFRGWLGRVGAREIIVGAMEHDDLVAYTSHLPQLAATALACTVAAQDSSLTGPGLIGATRLALSSYELWRDILATNTEAITEALSAYIQRLEHLRENLRTREMEAEFARAAEFARKIRLSN